MKRLLSFLTMVLLASPAVAQFQPVQGPPLATQADIAALSSSISSVNSTATSASTLAIANQTALAPLKPNSIGQVPGMGGGVQPSTIYVGLGTVLINSTTAATGFSSTYSGVGRTVTPATGIPYVGNRFSFHLGGIYTTPALNTAAIFAQIKWGSVIVTNLTSGALSSSLTNQSFSVDGSCTIKTISATAGASTMVCQGNIFSLTSAQLSFISPTPVAVDTTTPQALDVTMNWSGTITGSPTATILESKETIEW